MNIYIYIYIYIILYYKCLVDFFSKIMHLRLCIGLTMGGVILYRLSRINTRYVLARYSHNTR